MVSSFEQVQDQLPLNSKVLNGEFLLQGTLGEGSFSKVKLAYSLSNQRHVAIKVHKTVSEELFNTLAKEMQILKTVEHDNLVRFFGCYE